MAPPRRPKLQRRIVDARTRRREAEPRAEAGGTAESHVMPPAPVEGGGMPSADDDGLTVSEMPAGQMTGGPATGSQMAGGDTGGAAMVGMTPGEMPRGEMRGSLSGEMPSAGMTVAGMAAAMGAGADSGMPAGQMAGGDVVPNVGAIDLPGEWRLVLVPASGVAK